MDKKIINKKNLIDIILNTIGLILLIIFFYKLYFESFIAISGDELNSILVYSTNLKTILLKNFPGNVTFFHFFGYIKSLLIGYELNSYRIITFVFFLIHLLILKKMKFGRNETILFCIILISTNFSLYAGLYIGYIFSSCIFVLIAFLLNSENRETYNKIILFFLFIQIYNHLVNLYLVMPIILGLFIFSKKKKFLKELLIYFILPTLLFYFLSIILTGIAINSINTSDINYVFDYLSKNFFSIFYDGIIRIFFYEAYSKVKDFNLINFLNELYNFDKWILLFFILSIIIPILKFNYVNSIFIVIQISHFIMLFLINKQPAPRIFTAFMAFYLVITFISFKNNRFVLNELQKNTILSILLILFLSFKVYNFNYSEVVKKSIYAKDIRSKENQISLKFLNKNCSLQNYDFNELQKRNFYFNYLNKCKKKFKLNEFLNYYRS